MAFLPEKTFLEETLISAYDLSTGNGTFVSADLSKFTTFSLHFAGTDIAGGNSFELDQGNDNTNWSELATDVELPIGTSNFIIDKQNFSSKYVRINFVTTTSGTITCTLIAKR